MSRQLQISFSGEEEPVLCSTASWESTGTTTSCFRLAISNSWLRGLFGICLRIETVWFETCQTCLFGFAQVSLCDAQPEGFFREKLLVAKKRRWFTNFLPLIVMTFSRTIRRVFDWLISPVRVPTHLGKPSFGTDPGNPGEVLEFHSQSWCFFVLLCFLVTPCCSQGAILQVTLLCHPVVCP